MNTVRPTLTTPQIMLAMQRVLRLNQRELAALMGVSSRTIIRYYRGRGTFGASAYEKAARACHPHDRALASQLAAYVGKTLVDMGLERPPSPPAPAAPARPSPTDRHLVDSIVCVAAEAMQSTPQAMRPSVLAALERAVALGMTAEDVLAAMTPAKPAKTKS